MIIFSYLFIKLRISQLTVLHIAANAISVPCLTLEKVIETHFTRKTEINVKLRSSKNQLSGYIRVERNEQPEQYVTPMIVYLESLFFS